MYKQKIWDYIDKKSIAIIIYGCVLLLGCIILTLIAVKIGATTLNLAAIVLSGLAFGGIPTLIGAINVIKGVLEAKGRIERISDVDTPDNLELGQEIPDVVLEKAEKEYQDFIRTSKPEEINFKYKGKIISTFIITFVIPLLLIVGVCGNFIATYGFSFSEFVNSFLYRMKNSVESILAVYGFVCLFGLLFLLGCFEFITEIKQYKHVSEIIKSGVRTTATVVHVASKKYKESSKRGVYTYYKYAYYLKGYNPVSRTYYIFKTDYMFVNNLSEADYFAADVYISPANANDYYVNTYSVMHYAY